MTRPWPPRADRYRTKPIVVDAMQWTGSNPTALTEWGAPIRFVVRLGAYFGETDLCLWAGAKQAWVPVPVGHWIVESVAGEYSKYSLFAPDVFEATDEADVRP